MRRIAGSATRTSPTAIMSSPVRYEASLRKSKMSKQILPGITLPSLEDFESPFAGGADEDMFLALVRRALRWIPAERVSAREFSGARLALQCSLTERKEHASRYDDNFARKEHIRASIWSLSGGNGNSPLDIREQTTGEKWEGRAYVYKRLFEAPRAMYHGQGCRNQSHQPSPSTRLTPLFLWELTDIALIIDPAEN